MKLRWSLAFDILKVFLVSYKKYWTLQIFNGYLNEIKNIFKLLLNELHILGFNYISHYTEVPFSSKLTKIRGHDLTLSFWEFNQTWARVCNGKRGLNKKWATVMEV